MRSAVPFLFWIGSVRSKYPWLSIAKNMDLETVNARVPRIGSDKGQSVKMAGGCLLPRIVQHEAIVDFGDNIVWLDSDMLHKVWVTNSEYSDTERVRAKDEWRVVAKRIGSLIGS